MILIIKTKSFNNKIIRNNDGVEVDNRENNSNSNSNNDKKSEKKLLKSKIENLSQSKKFNQNNIIKIRLNF